MFKLIFNPIQSTLIGLNDSNHNLASPTNVKQKSWTLTPSWNVCVSIQSFILRRCASASSSGFPENSGLKCDQYNCGTWTGWIDCTRGIGGCTGWVCGWGASGACSAYGAEGVGRAGSSASAMLSYVFMYMLTYLISILFFILALTYCFSFTIVTLHNFGVWEVL